MDEHPIILKIALSFALLFLAIGVSWYPVKSLILIVAVAIFSTIFRKAGTFLIIAALLVSIPVGIVHGFLGRMPWIGFMEIPYFHFNLQENQVETITLYPDTKMGLNDVENVEIRTVSAEVVFTDSDQVEYPSQMRVERIGKTLKLIGMEKHKKYVVMLGTAKGFETIKLDSVGLSVKGRMRERSRMLNMYGTGMTLNAEIRCENLRVDGTGVGLRGSVEASRVEIDGTGLDLSLKLKGVKYLEIDGTGINGRLEYLDRWDGKRYLRIDGTAGKLTVHLRSDNPGELDVKKSGVFLFVEERGR